MTASITLVLPPEARVQPVSAALAIAAGAPFHTNEANGTPYPVVPSLRIVVNPESIGLVFVELRAGDGDILRAGYHFEFGDKGERGMSLPFDARWLALALAVVGQLGGSVSVDTLDGSAAEVLSVPSRWPADAEDAGYGELQQLVMGVPRISNEDIERAKALLNQ
jgi:hypothetical protein